MPKNVISQPFSYVTETRELYIICEYEDKYEMYRVNLDEYEERQTDDRKHIYVMEYRLTI